jgi:hypothetical protein
VHIEPLNRGAVRALAQTPTKEGTIAKLNESDFFELLKKRADGVQSDIRADFPEHDDTGYDLYVEVMPETEEIVGVIDMGDLYCEVFMDMDDGTIDPDPSLDPHETIEKILHKRMNAGAK